MTDCLQHYRLYKAACRDEAPLLTEADVAGLDRPDAEQLYKSVIRDLLAAKECAAERRYVKKNCYNNVADFGHDKAIDIAD